MINLFNWSSENNCDQIFSKIYKIYSEGLERRYKKILELRPQNMIFFFNGTQIKTPEDNDEMEYDIKFIYGFDKKSNTNNTKQYSLCFDQDIITPSGNIVLALIYNGRDGRVICKKKAIVLENPFYQNTTENIENYLKIGHESNQCCNSNIIEYVMDKLDLLDPMNRRNNKEIVQHYIVELKKEIIIDPKQNDSNNYLEIFNKQKKQELLLSPNDFTLLISLFLKIMCIHFKMVTNKRNKWIEIWCNGDVFMKNDISNEWGWNFVDIVSGSIIPSKSINFFVKKSRIDVSNSIISYDILLIIQLLEQYLIGVPESYIEELIFIKNKFTCLRDIVKYTDKVKKDYNIDKLKSRLNYTESDMNSALINLHVNMHTFFGSKEMCSNKENNIIHSEYYDEKNITGCINENLLHFDNFIKNITKNRIIGENKLGEIKDKSSIPLNKNYNPQTMEHSFFIKNIDLIFKYASLNDEIIFRFDEKYNTIVKCEINNIENMK
jgi:hypothetical protein